VRLAPGATEWRRVVFPLPCDLSFVCPSLALACPVALFSSPPSAVPLSSLISPLASLLETPLIPVISTWPRESHFRNRERPFFGDLERDFDGVCLTESEGAWAGVFGAAAVPA
jgi:hypothetical protein